MIAHEMTAAMITARRLNEIAATCAAFALDQQANENTEGVVDADQAWADYRDAANSAVPAAAPLQFARLYSKAIVAERAARMAKAAEGAGTMQHEIRRAIQTCDATLTSIRRATAVAHTAREYQVSGTLADAARMIAEATRMLRELE